MLLQRLRDRPVSQSLPTGYQRRPIRSIITLAADGRFLGVVDTATETDRRGRLFVAPSVKRTSGDRPILFADGADYLLGIAEDDEQPGRAKRRAALHRSLAHRCAEATRNPTVSAGVAFLDALGTDAPLLNAVCSALPDSPGDLTVRVGDTLLIDLPEVAQFWATVVVTGVAPTVSKVRCVVCGQQTSPVEVWPVSIKRLAGGQTSGTQLVSGNEEAFESYGLRRGSTAATCAACAEHIGNSLNELVESHENHYTVGPVTYVFWTTAAETFSLLTILSQAQPDEVRALLDAPRTARTAALAAVAGKFYASALSANGSRVVVRGWLETTVPTARENVARYFRRQEVIGRTGEQSKPIGLYALLLATARRPEELRPGLFSDLLHAIVTGDRLPTALLGDVVRRVRAQRDVTTPQAALLRLLLLDHGGETNVMAQLDRDRGDPAFLCGRLLAEIDDIQRAALGFKVNTTVVDRFFGSASSAPGSVFGTLLRGVQPHLAKLRKTRPGVERRHEAELEDILGRLPAFPRTLSVQEQAAFSLGFYQQRAAVAAARRAARGAATAPEAVHSGNDTSVVVEEDS